MSCDATTRDFDDDGETLNRSHRNNDYFSRTVFVDFKDYQSPTTDSLGSTRSSQSSFRNGEPGVVGIRGLLNELSRPHLSPCSTTTLFSWDTQTAFEVCTVRGVGTNVVSPGVRGGKDPIDTTPPDDCPGNSGGATCPLLWRVTMKARM